jgi:hypothetical protein
LLLEFHHGAGGLIGNGNHDNVCTTLLIRLDDDLEVIDAGFPRARGSAGLPFQTSIDDGSMYTLPSGCVTLICTVNIAVGPSGLADNRRRSQESLLDG